MPGLDDVADVTLDAGGHIAAAVGILVAGYILAKVLQLVARRLLGRPELAGALGPSIVQLICSAVFIIVMFLAVGLALIALGVSATFVSTGALILIAIVAIALRESIANFAATVNFLMFQPFKRGELVETMGHFGTVREILLFNTVLLLLDQRLVTLPNSKIQEHGIVNYTRIGRVRADISLTVAYGEDLCRVKAVIADVASQDGRILADPSFSVVVDALGEDGVRLLIMPVVAPEHYWAVRNDLRERIKARFDGEGIQFAAARHEVRLTPTLQPDHSPQQVSHPG